VPVRSYFTISISTQIALHCSTYLMSIFFRWPLRCTQIPLTSHTSLPEIYPPFPQCIFLSNPSQDTRPTSIHISATAPVFQSFFPLPVPPNFHSFHPFRPSQSLCSHISKQSHQKSQLLLLIVLGNSSPNSAPPPSRSTCTTEKTSAC
jgi:hypothetical protein